MIFPEVKIFQPDSFVDHRGELYTVFNQEEHNLVFNHDKVAISKQYVLRGIHGDSKATKLITCLSGVIYLVIVDNIPESPNYLKWDSVTLSKTNRKQVLVPPMFGNGHLVLSDTAVFFYKWSYDGEYPDIKDQFSLNWKDPRINISWPINNEPILSERDKNSH
jgi:dTDP-4-dehydrorhamnose 3,5-epimerase